MVGGLQPFCLGEGNNVHAEKWTLITSVTEVIHLEYTNNKNENTTIIIIIINLVATWVSVQFHALATLPPWRLSPILMR